MRRPRKERARLTRPEPSTLTEADKAGGIAAWRERQAEKEKKAKDEQGPY